MGLTNSSVGANAADTGMLIINRQPGERVIALAGNPNVGKSTVFNALTGMNQHTGNWPGKTVVCAQGKCATDKGNYIFVDIPGTYSLMAHSAEEEVARNFICFGDPDAVVVVCDATCLERNLNLVLQTLEITSNVIVCVNLMDEAKRKKISIDTKLLSERLGVPVVGAVARKKHSLKSLMSAVDSVAKCDYSASSLRVSYPDVVEKAVSIIETALDGINSGKLNTRWLGLRLLERDESLFNDLKLLAGIEPDGVIAEAVSEAWRILDEAEIASAELKDIIVSSILASAEQVCDGAVIYANARYHSADRRIDRILTGKFTAYPIMLCLLGAVFWLTITGANYPSALLADLLFKGQDLLTDFFGYVNAPDWLHGVLVLGVYRVLAWVVSVMLPPMAIFFPLFTLLEDFGYLPRIAYNLDRPFKRCNACGKQALTMCMGFGCNAAGVVGCRIIDSPRERLLAILTNNFVPCNGRFPTLTVIITMFFAGAVGAFSSVFSVLILISVIVLGVLVTFGVTKLLSSTLLKGVPSSFTLELPPYRRPQFGKVLVRSIFDRTLFVLGRAAVVAAPAGLVIWLAANITVGDLSILDRCASFLDPFAQIMGLDGVILLAFILGFPANEIVLPIIIMAYTAQGTITDFESTLQLKALLVENGWTWITAVSTMLFSLLHWPCSTALLTIKKETGSLKWTALAATIPTVIGIAACILFNALAKLF